MIYQLSSNYLKYILFIQTSLFQRHCDKMSDVITCSSSVAPPCSAFDDRDREYHQDIKLLHTSD